MSEPKDRRRRLVPSVNTVKKKPPMPVVKPNTPAAVKSPGVIKDTRMEANTSKEVNPPGKAQVFILSPAILKQMGINIGNLQQNPPNEEVGVTKTKKGRPKKTNGNSADVKKALYDKLTEKKTKIKIPPQQIEENKIEVKAIIRQPNHPVKAAESLSTFNIPQKDEFVKPASPLVCRKSGSSNMETVSYFTSSLVMSPGEDISSYLAGYSKIPNTLPLVTFSEESKLPTDTSHYAAECHPINSSEYSVQLHPSEEISPDIQILNRSTNTNQHNINILPSSDDLNNSMNFGSDGNYSANFTQNVVPEQYYKIQMHPNHEEILTEQIQFIKREMQINSQLANSNPNQNEINISLTDIQNMTEHSLEEDDGAQDISESNDETFDYIIEDVNSDEIEKVDLMNVDFDLLNKETNDGMEHQQSYLCPEDANADSSQVILRDSQSMPPCMTGTESQTCERLPPFEIISPVSTIKNYLYGRNSNSPNSTNIQRNIDILLKSMNQSIQFSPQQTDNYIENTVHLISTNVTKEFESSDLINLNKEGNLTMESSQESANLTIPMDISGDVKLSINAAVIESKSPKTPIKNILIPIDQVNLDTETKFVTQDYMPVKYSPKSVIRHSSSSEEIQVRSIVVNQAQRVDEVKHTLPQHTANSDCLNTPFERTVTNKNLANGDKQLTKSNISNIRHSSSSEEIHVHSPTVDSKINQAQRAEEVKNSVPQHTTISEVLTMPSEPTITNLLTNKNLLKVDKQLTKSNISNIRHSSSSEEIHVHSPTVDSKINQALRAEEVKNSVLQHTTNSDVITIPSEPTVANLLLTNKNLLKVDKQLTKSNISNVSQSSSSEEIQASSSTVNNKVNYAQKLEKVKCFVPQHTTNSDVLNVPSEQTLTNKNSLKGEKQWIKSNIWNGRQGCLDIKTYAANSNQEWKRRNEIAMISDRILEERERMSQACRDEKSLNKIADYLKMFHQRKPLNKSDSKLEAERTESEIIKERKLHKEETGRDEMMHGVEKPGGQLTINGSLKDENTKLVNTIQNKILPNLRTLEIIPNANSAASENSDRNKTYWIKTRKPIANTDTSNIDLPHNSPASTSGSTSFAIVPSSGAGLHLPGTQSFLTYEFHSQAMFKAYNEHNNDDFDLFQDSLCESHEATAGVSDDIAAENFTRTNKSTDIKQNPSNITSPQFNEFERKCILNTSLKNVKTYSGRKNKYKNNDTKLIDLPNSSGGNVSLVENDLKIDEFNIGNVSYGLNTDYEKPLIKPYILSKQSVLAQELKRGYFQLKDYINNKSGKLKEKQDDTDVFSLAIDESLKNISPPKQPPKSKILEFEVSPSTSSDHFSSILPKKRFSRQGSFVKESRNNCLDESNETEDTSVSSLNKKELQTFINKDELPTIIPQQESLDFLEKKECSLSKKRFDTDQNESNQDDKLQSIGISTASLQILENNPPDNPKASNTELMVQNFESTSNDDDVLKESIEIVEDSNSQTNVHDNMSAIDLGSAVVSPRSNYQVSASIINEKVVCSSLALNSIVTENSSGDYEKCTQSELNKLPQLCLENDKKVISPKLNKIVCRPPKKSIIERVRTDLKIYSGDGGAILPSNDSQTIAPHSVPVQELLDTFSKAACNGDSLQASQEITDHSSVIEENTLVEIDSLDKNADVNPSENNNLQCPVISTHSTDETFVETSINNSTNEKEIKAGEIQRKIKGIPIKVKSIVKKKSLVQRTSQIQIQPVEESLTNIMTNVEQINNIENDNGLQSSNEKTDDNIYPETHIYSTVLASNDVLEKIHDAVRRESICAVDKSDSSYEDVIQIEIAEDPEKETAAANPTMNHESVGICEFSKNDIDNLKEETSTDSVSQRHIDDSDIDNNDSMDGDYSTAYNIDPYRDDHDPASVHSANAERGPTDESWNTSEDFQQPRTKISKRANIDTTIFGNDEKGKEEIQNYVPHVITLEDSETISNKPIKKISKKHNEKIVKCTKDFGGDIIKEDIEKCLENADNIGNDHLKGPDDDCPLSAIKSFDQSKRRRGRPPRGRPTASAPPKQSEKRSYQGKDSVTCAVCKQTLKKSSWPQHNLHIHKYLAWLEGDTPVDLQNEPLVISLLTMAKKKVELVCDKCGEKRASVLGYISHVLYMCQKTDEEVEALKETCTICKRRVLPSGMRVHLIAHTRTSVKTEKPPPVELPIEDETGGRRKRKAAEMAGNTFKKLKTGKEQPPQRDIKDLYKKPWFGRATGILYSIWKKQLVTDGTASCRRCKHKEASLEAINQHYVSTCHLIPEKVYQCVCCLFKSEAEIAMIDHIKEKHPGEIFVKIEESSNSEADHNGSDIDPEPQSSSEVDEYETDDEEKLFVRASRKKTSGASNNNKKTSAASNNNQSISSLNTSALSTEECKLPLTEEIRSFLPSFHFAYRVGSNLKRLYSLWNKKFVEKYYTAEGLFPKLGCNPLQALSTSEAEAYLPECKESIRMANSTTTTCAKNSKRVEWRKYKLFESDLFNGTQTFWCGGPVRGLAWAPGRNKECYVAVATDRSMNGFYKEDLHYKHKGIIQIWSVGVLQDKDKGCQRPASMVMGIAHSFGQVWNMTWCPSGCDTTFTPRSEVSQDGVRLGLLAAACSDGNVHIFAVANPKSVITSDSKIYATEPVASLKLHKDDTVTLGRTQCHATQVFWSQDLGHRVIAVGYSSGIVALFDLGSTSILLTSQHGNTTVCLPYFTFLAHRARITGLVLMPPVPGYTAPLICATAPSGCGIWSGDTRTFFRRGPYTGASVAPQWPQVIAYSEDVQPNAGSASILPVRISCGHMDRITIIEPGVIGGAVTPWNGGLLGLGLQGQLSARLHRCPYIPKDRKSVKEKFTHWIWHPEIVDLSKENKDSNEPGKLDKTQGKGGMKSGKGTVKSDQENKRKTPIIELATSFEEARENYGILFVNNPKSIPPLDGIYSLGTWPLWESLCVAVPGSPERFNYCAVGGRAGHCRVSFTPDIKFPSNYYPGAYKKTPVAK